MDARYLLQHSNTRVSVVPITATADTTVAPGEPNRWRISFHVNYFAGAAWIIRPESFPALHGVVLAGYQNNQTLTIFDWGGIVPLRWTVGAVGGGEVVVCEDILY
jgi:hypothetical protein